MIEQRSLVVPRNLPRVHLRTTRDHPLVFRKMIARTLGNPAPGDLVQAMDKSGRPAGQGLYNPDSQIPLRLLSFGDERIDARWWQRSLTRAVDLRQPLLDDPNTTACRLIHAEGDGLSGLLVDRYGAVLSAEVFSLGMASRCNAILNQLAKLCGAASWRATMDGETALREGLRPGAAIGDSAPTKLWIKEYGTEFQVDFKTGHKTGFFCDQRQNRRQLANWCAGRRVLDLCSYTGGFAIQALRAGKAADVTAVDIDEAAIAVARKNAQRNRVQCNFVRADCFAYAREMIRNGQLYDVVVLDPPKLIAHRKEQADGERKYLDLNRLAIQLVRDQGILLTCSCSGLLGAEEFRRIVTRAVWENAKHHPVTAQIIGQTGAGSDHPVSIRCPESQYLKAIWLRIEKRPHRVASG